MSNDDDTRPVRVFKIELFIVDHDKVGADGIKEVIENQKFPNRCISPHVVRTESHEVQWNDDHPLNGRDTWRAAYEAMFHEAPMSTMGRQLQILNEHGNVVHAKRQLQDAANRYPNGDPVYARELEERALRYAREVLASDGLRHTLAATTLNAYADTIKKERAT